MGEIILIPILIHGPGDLGPIRQEYSTFSPMGLRQLWIRNYNRNFKLPFMYRCQNPINNGTVEILIRTKMWKIPSFLHGESLEISLN